MKQLLIGGNCDGPKPEPDPGPNFYCAPVVLQPAPSMLDSIGKTLATIVGSEPSVDRSSTFFVQDAVHHGARHPRRCD